MLIWNVFYDDFNGQKIKTTNILDHASFRGDCVKAAKKYKNDKEKFLDEVHRSLMYYYWCKCEWEVIISSWPPSDRQEAIKVDVYSQVMNNWHVFSEYIWEHRKEL